MGGHMKGVPWVLLQMGSPSLCHLVCPLESLFLKEMMGLCLAVREPEQQVFPQPHALPLCFFGCSYEKTTWEEGINCVLVFINVVENRKT